MMNINHIIADIKTFSGKANDIWALGVTLFALIYNELPYWAETELGVLEKIHSADLKLLEKRNISQGLKRILLRMLDKNPLTRATLAELKKDVWLNEGYAVSLDSREVDFFANYTEDELTNKGIPISAVVFAVSNKVMLSLLYRKNWLKNGLKITRMRQCNFRMRTWVLLKLKMYLKILVKLQTKLPYQTETESVFHL